jgi:hypothetical protein
MLHPHSLRQSVIAAVCFLAITHQSIVHGCCAVAGGGQQVVNANQSVIILWDKETQTQHFIRKASFKTDAEDVGFLIPSPSRPQLDESGDSAFTTLANITAPVSMGGGFPLGCSAAPVASSPRYQVQVIEEKRVAGFDATVLTAQSGTDLMNWLKDNGYAYSPAVAEWAKPYLGGNWHFTALKITKDPQARHEADLKAASLRISFKTDKPLFPYREPESASASKSLGANKRLLRIYFIADSAYSGKINGKPWSGKAVWSGDITPHKSSLIAQLKLPENTGPKTWWLTEFEDIWPYSKAAGDVYFSPDSDLKFHPRVGHRDLAGIDISIVVLLGISLLWPFRRRLKAGM